jgi:hypothetical protein
MKYKNIPSMLHNFGDSFVSPLNYLEGEHVIDIVKKITLESKDKQIIINFETAEISPTGNYPEKLNKSIKQYSKHLPKHMESQNVDPASVSNMALTCKIVKNQVRGIIFRAIITAKDDKGKKYSIVVN